MSLARRPWPRRPPAPPGWPAALAGAALAACGAPLDDFADGVLVLPPELREVSAIAALDEHTLACVQDEEGALFVIDLRGQRPPRALPFGPPGDYEGLARVGSDFWILRSDGHLLRTTPQDGGLAVAAQHRLTTAHHDWEGLCFDPDRGELLALPKDRIGEGQAERSRRFVFAVDPATGAMRPEPVLELDVRALLDEAKVHGFELRTRITPKGKTRTVWKVRGSELLPVPGSEELLLLSSADRALLRVDRAGRLRGLRLLDDDLPKPEGMAWLPDGRLLVASEGTDGPGLVRVVALP